MTLPHTNQGEDAHQLNSYRILHLEDNPVDALVVQSHLAASDLNFEILRVETEPEYRAAIENYFKIISESVSEPKP